MTKECSKDAWTISFCAVRIFQCSFAFGFEDHMLPDKIYCTVWSRRTEGWVQKNCSVTLYNPSFGFSFIDYLNQNYLRSSDGCSLGRRRQCFNVTVGVFFALSVAQGVKVRVGWILCNWCFFPPLFLFRNSNSVTGWVRKTREKKTARCLSGGDN